MTNTARHTPGPWLPGIRDGDVEPVIAGGVRIAEMIPTDCTKEEFEANCSLVYAAPNLLAALETLIEKADDILAAIDGTTDQFEPEAAALSEAASMAEKITLAARGRS
jgi:hypothetical protein